MLNLIVFRQSAVYRINANREWEQNKVFGYSGYSDDKICIHHCQVISYCYSRETLKTKSFIVFSILLKWYLNLIAVYMYLKWNKYLTNTYPEWLIFWANAAQSVAPVGFLVNKIHRSLIFAWFTIFLCMQPK